MIATALLLIYAVLAGSAAAHRLRRARWPLRSPRLGILAWQALSASVVLAAFLAGATVAVPVVPVSAKLANVVDACWLAIREHYSTPGGAAVASLGVLLMLAVAGRLGFVLAVEWVATSRRRRRQRDSLLLVAGRHAVTGALVLPHPTSAVYCLPGRRGVIVCTSAAIATLDVHQLNAVLAHERAHLHARHHLVLTVAASLRTAFPFVPAFGLAHEQLIRLVEMQADDTATASCDRHVLATALVRLAEGVVPAVAIGASGASALARVCRLAEPSRPLGPARSALASAAALSLIMLPLFIAAGPAVVAAVLDYCPPGFHPTGPR